MQSKTSNIPKAFLRQYLAPIIHSLHLMMGLVHALRHAHGNSHSQNWNDLQRRVFIAMTNDDVTSFSSDANMEAR